MPPSKMRFVAACQQVLALAVVVTALAPAASVVSLDVVAQVPPAAGYPSAMAAYAASTTEPSVLPATSVEPEVRELPLTASTVANGADSARPTSQARLTQGDEPGSAELTSLSQAVEGYGAVGITWQHGVDIAEDQISFEVRTYDQGQWSAWTPMTYHDDHAPEADGPEARHERPGTDEILVGEVDRVQVRAVAADGVVPPDMKLAVIDPGEPDREVVQSAAIDTAALGGESRLSPLAAEHLTGEGLTLQAATFTPKPVIYSRAQWGADESLRDKSSLRYGEVHAGFVHHTVNANDYTREQVPSIIRGIYAYHTQSRGWSDIGYNFLVDRFGRIWEGRYGGVDRPVVGAHTLGYNDYSFAMSAIGNYEVAAPSDAMVQAYGALFGWKLSLHGVDASSTRQRVGSDYFQAINGHRDAGTTACPGRYLYAELPQIRQLAAGVQRGWSGRELESNLASTRHPDLVVRRASDGQAFVIPTGGLTRFGGANAVSAPWASTDTVVASRDLTGDGRADAVVVDATGASKVYPGNGKGGFGAGIKPSTIFSGYDLLAAVGDLTGDGRNDLVGRNPSTGRLAVFAGNGAGGFARAQLDAITDWTRFDLLIGAGDLTGDGRADLLARDRDGRLWRYPGTGTAQLGSRVQVPGSWGQYDAIAGGGDYSRDGRPDLFVRVPGSPGYLRLGQADGSFSAPHGPLNQLTTATALTGGNLIGNRATDLLGRSGGRWVLFRNAGSFDAGSPIPTGINLSAADVLLNAGDWDRDGRSDLIVRVASTGELQLRLGDGRGRFGAPIVIGTGFGQVGLLTAVGDMTGDGWPDLMGQPAGGAMRLYPGRGVQGLKADYVAFRSVDSTAQIAVGRWNDDGAPDTMLRRGDVLRLGIGNGPGGLTGTSALSLDVSPYDWVIGVRDANADGHADLIVRTKETGDLFLLPGTADGFGSRRLLAEGMLAYDLAG